MKVAYAGAAGAFSHEAALVLAGDHEPAAYPSFEAVAAAVLAGEAALGVLPLCNRSAGPVPGVAGLIASSRLQLAGDLDLPVRLHLLALPGVAVGGIRTVVSHPMALRQCSRVLAELGVATQGAANTALAARSLCDRAVGVLASEAAASLYGLEIVRRDVHDDPANFTRFVLVRAGPSASRS